MNRRDFAKGVGAGICATTLPSYAVRTAAAASRPNILIITTDQQSADAASYRMGTRYIHTPNMDRIAAQGLVHARAYCANPLCVPSRTSMFSGRYPTTIDVMDNSDLTDLNLTFTKYPKMFPLMGSIFQAGGYETGYFGKWHIPCPVSRTDIHGFATTKWGRGSFSNVSDDPETATATAAFIRQKRQAPFLAVASFMNPHNIAEWARGQELPLGDIGQPPPPDQLPPLRANLAPQKDEPDTVTLMRRSYQSAPMFPVADFDETRWRQYQWAYYRLIEKSDAQIGFVLDALRAADREQDTLVILSADHGDCQGAHRWNQKTVLYEESTRVPFVVSLPGTIKPGVSNRLVNTGIDLIPTLCDYAGIAAPAGLPGLSVTSSKMDSRKFVVVSNKMLEGAPLEGRKPNPTGRMLRSDRYKYCVYSEGQRRESLVDLQDDPGELVNLVPNPKFNAVLKEHRTMLAQWCHETQDAFQVPG